MSKTVLVLPGDGIGPEVMVEAIKILETAIVKFKLPIDLETGLVGGAAIEEYGVPLPKETLEKAKACDAVLLGAVGGPKWDALDMSLRPEKGLLGLRSELKLFANLRPAILYPQLADASSLKPDIVSGLDILIVRELTGGIYFGKPRGIRRLANDDREGFNTYVYNETEIKKIGHVAFELAMQRSKRLCSVDKANVLEVTRLWREIFDDMARDYPEVELTHMYVDNAAMQLVKAPKQFDVMVTGNMFGDILSDEAAMLTGSIGMLPSASLDENRKGMYEPCHGSAPDIAGLGLANPLATILSVAMMLRYTFNENDAAVAIESAVEKTLDAGFRTKDIEAMNCQTLSTSEMGDVVRDNLVNI